MTCFNSRSRRATSLFTAVALPCVLSLAWGMSGQAVVAQQHAAPAQQQQQINVLAVVNGQEITRQQMANQCLRRFGSDVLQSIVNKQLVLNECQRRGINLTEKDVNDELVFRAKNFGMSGERYVELICSQRNISQDRLKNDIIWSELALRRLAAEKLQVSPEELNERMETEFGPKVQVSEIVVKTKEKADQLFAMLQQTPEDFGRLAKDNSVNPNSASVRGLLPAISRHSGMPAFEQVAFALEPGQISNVFEVQGSYVILRCERQYPATQLTPEQSNQAKERIVEQIANSKLADSATAIFQQLQKTVKVTNVMNDPELSRQMPGVAAMVGESKITKRYLAEECIARSGRETLESEINRTLLMQSLQQKKMQVAQADIDAEIERAALSFGHLKKDGSTDIGAWLSFVTRGDESKVDFYIEDEVWPTVALKKLVSNEVVVTQEDMKKGFEANYGPRVEALAIVLKDNRQATNVFRMARANPTAKYFGELAFQFSVEPASRGNYGQVPPIARHSGRPTLEEEAFSLKPGEISKVVQVGEHWIILFCQGRTTPVVEDFDAVKDELKADILEKKMRFAMAEHFEKMRSSAQIDNFLAGTSQTGAQRTLTARQQSQNPNVPFRGNNR